MEIEIEGTIPNFLMLKEYNTVRLKKNGIISPPNFSEFKCKILELSYNQFNRLPLFPIEIEELYLNFNNLSGSLDFSRYVNLKKLALNDNKLQAKLVLPESLEYLDIRFNRYQYINFLPPKLKTLKISYNKIKEVNIPDSVEELCAYNTEIKILPGKNVKLFNGRPVVNLPENIIIRPPLENYCVITYEPLTQFYNFCETCKKEFSEDVLIEWLQINDTCPNCREKIVLKNRYKVYL